MYKNVQAAVHCQPLHSKTDVERDESTTHIEHLETGIFPTLVVLTLFPVLQDQPVRSGRTLHSSPSIHGCMWHHHFWATIEAVASNGELEGKK